MKIPIIIWIYHTHLIDEIVSLINKDDFYPIFCVCNSVDNSIVVDTINTNFSEFKIQYYDNRGADIFSFLTVITSIDSPFFIKVHSKLDTDWRKKLILPLLNNYKEHINSISQSEIRYPWNKSGKNNIGMIAYTDCIVSNYEFTNSTQIKEICNIIDIDYEKVKFGRYVSGTMFLSRTDIFQKYFNKKTLPKILNLLEYGKVSDKDNGTYTHALERIFGYIISNENMIIKSIT